MMNVYRRGEFFTYHSVAKAAWVVCRGYGLVETQLEPYWRGDDHGEMAARARVDELWVQATTEKLWEKVKPTAYGGLYWPEA